MRVAQAVSREPETRTMEDEIVPADKRLRRRVLCCAGLMTVGGLLMLTILYRLLDVPPDATEQELKSAGDHAVRFVTIMAWLTGLSFVGIGLWFLGVGHRIRRSGQFPPPGMKVMNDTPVRTGAKARKVANLATVTGLLSAALGPALAWQLGRLAMAALGR